MLCRKGWTGNSQQTMPELNSNICILLSLFRLYRLLDTRKELRLYDYDSLSVGENFDDFITSDDVYERFEKLVMMVV